MEQRARTDQRVAAETPETARELAEPRAFVLLASRMLVAQAGASVAIGIGYSRRNVPWLLLTVVAAIALCSLAGLIRSGSHTVWLTAVSVEAGLVAVGLTRFAYTRYMGGSLLAILTMGVLVHPAVASAFAHVRQRAPIEDDPALTERTRKLIAGRHVTAELPDARQGGGLPADGALATLLSQGIPPEGGGITA